MSFGVGEVDTATRSETISAIICRRWIFFFTATRFFVLKVSVFVEDMRTYASREIVLMKVDVARGSWS